MTSGFLRSRRICEAGALTEWGLPPQLRVFKDLTTFAREVASRGLICEGDG